MIVQSRQNDYEHYIKCECGWQGWAADMRHGYIPDKDDVVLMDFCPQCGSQEDVSCEIYTIKQKEIRRDK